MSEWTNLALPNLPAEAAKAASAGLKPLLRVDHKSYGMCCRNGPVFTNPNTNRTIVRMALCPGWQTAAQNLTQSVLLPMIKAGTLAGLFLGDELLLAGMSYDNFTAYAGFFRTNLPKDAILYMNFGSSGIHYPKSAGGDSSGVWFWPGVPPMLDYLSMDLYEGVNVTQQTFNLTIFPTLRAHQQVLLVPQVAVGEQGTGPNEMTDADAESFLLAQLAEYWAWAQADTRVAGFMCFYLMNSTGGPGATGGAQGEPLLLAELKKIGRAIVGGNGSVST